MKKEYTLKDMEKELFKTKKAKKLYEKEVNRLRIAHQITELRERHHLTQKRLAKLLHTKQQVISRIEKYNYKPSITTLEKIAEVFNKKLIIKFV
jgi:DNA-binding XRE family transcriptional regulator